MWNYAFYKVEVIKFFASYADALKTSLDLFQTQETYTYLKSYITSAHRYLSYED